MSYYLGIDGGGTKTTCAVGDESQLLATATAGPSNIVRVGEVQARESLQQSVRQACAAAGITPAQVVRTCVGGSGAAHPELAEVGAPMSGGDSDRLRSTSSATCRSPWKPPSTPARASLSLQARVRLRTAATSREPPLRAGGWGFAIGDEGSAHWIGRAAVSAVLRAADPRDGTPEPLQASAFSAALCKVWGVTSLADLARAANSVPPPDFAALFPAVAASQDDLAVRVLTQAGRELADVAAVVIRRLFSEGHTASVPVAMTGGVFRHAPLVRQVFYNELRALDSRVEVNPQVVEPVEGALRMARRGT